MNHILPEAGGPSFTFALFLLNGGFLFWEKLRYRVDYYENEAKATVSQNCANVMDVSPSAKLRSDGLLRSVETWFVRLRRTSLFFIQLAAASSIALLFIGWHGKEAILLLLPLSLYSFLSWVWYRIFLRRSYRLLIDFPAAVAPPVLAGQPLPPPPAKPSDTPGQACALHSNLIKRMKAEQKEANGSPPA